MSQSASPTPPFPTPELTPKAVAKRIGREYVEMDTLPNENEHITKQTYREIEEKVFDLYRDIPVDVTFQSGDPYEDYEDMATSVGRDRELKVYDKHTDHPYFSHLGQLAFRAVHDWYGHLSADVDFSPDGEYTKWEHMQKHFDSRQNRVMFAEVVGQVGAVHYLKDGFADNRFEQRAFFAPDRWMSWMYQAVD